MHINRLITDNVDFNGRSVGFRKKSQEKKRKRVEEKVISASKERIGEQAQNINTESNSDTARSHKKRKLNNWKSDKIKKLNQFFQKLNLIRDKSRNVEKFDYYKQLLKEVFFDIKKKINAINVNSFENSVDSMNLQSEIMWLAAAWEAWDIVQSNVKENPNLFINTEYKGITVLWFVAINGQWDLFNELFKVNSKFKVNAAPEGGPDEGKSVLWCVAESSKWDLFEEILESNPEADVNVSPKYGKLRGANVLWQVAAGANFDLVEEILNLYPKADVNSAPRGGRDKGINVLWYAAVCKKWKLVEKMLTLNPKANASAAPKKGLNKEINVLWYAAKNDKWKLVNRILSLDPKIDVTSRFCLSDSFVPVSYSVVSLAIQANAERVLISIYLILGKNSKTNLLKEEKRKFNKVEVLIVRNLKKIDFLLDGWNLKNTNHDLLKLPIELRRRIAYLAFNSELPGVPFSIFERALVRREETIFQYNKNKALNSLSMKGFKMFQWSREGGPLNPIFKDLNNHQIKSCHDLIKHCIKTKFQEKKILLNHKNRDIIINRVFKEISGFNIDLINESLDKVIREISIEEVSFIRRFVSFIRRF